MDRKFSTHFLLSPLCRRVMLADFHNVGLTPDINDELNKCAKGVDGSSAVYFSLVLSVKKGKEMDVPKSAIKQALRSGIKRLSLRFIQE